ncbi:MAG: hypothetical protein HOY69_34840 [Streptomyces sp.]|nr:hypothetical protein [Streptomyces sp.]
MTAATGAHDAPDDDTTDNAMERQHHPEETPADEPAAAHGTAGADRAPAADAPPVAPGTSARHEIDGIDAIGGIGGIGALNEVNDISAICETGDEAALRDLFHQAVRDIRPAPDALEHLRRAVPARRQHRRQAMAGGVAALLLVGAAVPALIHAADTGGSTVAAPAGTAGTHASQPDEDGHLDTWGSTDDTGQADGGRDGDGSGRHATTGGVAGQSNTSASPGSLTPADAPACSSSQLGKGSSKAGSPDSDGRIYGWFRVANVSDVACAVPPDPGTVAVIAHGSADSTQITVVNHTAGDPATGLPSPADDEPVVLAPGQTYEVAFAWVPAGTGPGGCPPTSPPPDSPTATPSPTDTGAPVSGDSGATDAPVAPDTPSGPDGPTSGTAQPAAISLTHTPAAGAPLVVGPTLQGTCAGTVYTTDPIADPVGATTS